MRRIFRFSVVIVIAVLFVLYLARTAFAGTWLSFDDGNPESSTGGPVAVKFSLPSGWPHAYVLKISFWIFTINPNGPGTFTANIYDSDGTTQLLLPAVTLLATSQGWIEIDVSSNNIMVLGDFYVSYTGTTPNPTSIGADTENRPVDTYYWNSGWQPWGNIFHALIRVEVNQDPPSNAPSNPYHYVGGELFSTNKLAVLSPYLALIGLAGVVASAAVVMKKRRRK